MPEVGDSLLARLRAETQPYHSALERRLDILAHLRTAVSYRILLETLHGLYCPLEVEIAQPAFQLPLWLPDLGTRMRTASLRRDLRILGSAWPETLPDAPIPPLRSLSEQFGCMYVLEGSTLGGQIISRQIEETLTYTTESGGSFFAGYGPETGAMWKTFCRAIESYAACHPESRHNVIGSAITTFGSFVDWIEKKL